MSAIEEAQRSVADAQEAVQAARSTIKVYLHANLRWGRAGRWTEVDGSDPEVVECLRRGLLSVEGPDGQPAPAQLPPRRCCGG